MEVKMRSKLLLIKPQVQKVILPYFFSFYPLWSYKGISERLKIMLELEFRCGGSLAPVLHCIKFGTSTPPSPCDCIFTGEGGEKGLTLSLCSRGACEYPHLILKSLHISKRSECICKFSTRSEILWSKMFPC